MYVHIDVAFEWDRAKNDANVAKHGIGFELASRIFEGRVLTRTDDRRSYGERREVSLGMVEDALILAVIHTDRNGRIRIISARRANRTERTRYDGTLQAGAQPE